MPLYSFRCEPCDVERDEIFRFSARPEVIECLGCGGESRYVIRMSRSLSLSAGQEREASAGGSAGLVMHAYRCRGCEHDFEELIDHRDGEHFEDLQKCPKCGVVDSKWIPAAKIDRWSERFPYYDRGLGVMLQSKDHRRQICRDRGLTPVDGDWDLDPEFRKMDDQNAREVREYDEYVDRLDNDPAFRAYRKAAERGMI